MSGGGFLFDASVAVKLVLTEPGSDTARRLARRRLVAPDLLLPECANIIWKAVRRKELEPAQAQFACVALLALPFELMSSRELLPAALDRAVSLGHPAYDCLYLELAARLDLPLVTADRRLRQLAGAGARVIGLDDLS